MSELDTLPDVDIEDRVDPGQKKTVVYRHPLRWQIEALLRRGKSAWWVSEFLAEQYPVEDENGDRHPDATHNKRLNITDETLEAYRDRWLPDAAPGIDIVLSEIDDIVGRRFPGSERGPGYELELLEMATDAAQYMFGMALKADEDLGMGVQETTLSAHGALVDTVKTSVDIKTRLGVAGYEAAPERSEVEINSTSRNFSVELHGQMNRKTGKLEAADKGKVSAVLGLLKQPEAVAEAMLEQAAGDDGPDATDEG